MLWCCWAVKQLRTGHRAAISAGSYLTWWSLAEPVSLHLAYYPSRKSDMNYWHLKDWHMRAFLWVKGSSPRVCVRSCFLLFYYHKFVPRKTKMNTVQESVKIIKTIISLWLLRLKVSLSFSCYFLGSHFISSSISGSHLSMCLTLVNKLAFSSILECLKYCW